MVSACVRYLLLYLKGPLSLPRMKSKILVFTAILLIIAVLYIIFLRECKKPLPCPAEDEIIVKKADWKSMIDAANKPAIVHIDTVYLKGDIIYVNNPLPQPDPKDTITYTYSDSLVKDDINVWYNFKSEGKLLERTWSYKPLYTLITRVDSIPYPVPVEIEKPVPSNGLWLYGAAGGNANMFIPGAGLDYITKKQTEMGIMYQRYGNNNVISFKLGVKLFKNK